MADAAFWTGRLRRFGHTGWADAAIYAYDQRLRLRAVAGLLAAGWPAQRRRALDFGCGVGDFSALLAAHFEAVTAHDISDEILATARQRVRLPSVSWTADRGAALAAGPYDLILSITVLQHLGDDAELERLVAAFAAALTDTGRVVLLESTAAQAVSPAAYIRLRTEAQLTGMFEAAGLRLLHSRAFQHPVDAPTAGYARYRRRLDVRALGRLASAGVGWAWRRLEAVAERCAAQDTAYLRDDGGPTRLMVFGRGAGAGHG